jgi:hypothetical protein
LIGDIASARWFEATDSASIAMATKPKRWTRPVPKTDILMIDLPERETWGAARPFPARSFRSKINRVPVPA